MSDTPRTERLLETIEREKKDIWQALKIVTDWARGLERECTSLEANLLRPEARPRLTNREQGHLERMRERVEILQSRVRSGNPKLSSTIEWGRELRAIEWAIGKLDLSQPQQGKA